jgi:hypothetical protein
VPGPPSQEPDRSRDGPLGRADLGRRGVAGSALLKDRDSIAQRPGAPLTFYKRPLTDDRTGITIDLSKDLIDQAERLGLGLDSATVEVLLAESLDAGLAVRTAAGESGDAVAYEEWFRQAVAEGIADAATRRTASFDVVRDRLLGGR